METCSTSQKRNAPQTSEERCRRPRTHRRRDNERAPSSKPTRETSRKNNASKGSGLASTTVYPTDRPPCDARRNPGQKKDLKGTSHERRWGYLESQFSGWPPHLSDPIQKHRGCDPNRLAESFCLCRGESIQTRLWCCGPADRNTNPGVRTVARLRSVLHQSRSSSEWYSMHAAVLFGRRFEER